MGTVEECRARLGQYEKLVVFTVKQDLEDSFDAEGMAAGGKRLLEACNAIDDGLWEAFGGQYQVLASGGCGRCEDCTYPHAPCRCPEKAHHSLAAYGILVSKLARQAGSSTTTGPTPSPTSGRWPATRACWRPDLPEEKRSCRDHAAAPFAS